ncbi:EAL domain-containing protein [Anaerostipes sp.]|uniref:EAL domain-containing protein n=1 Tax=Anaerostipes sp. TaxID=1872530 RepID=UPI0025BC5DA6|nr:EAL domain-containing protein [Anaerostipes sp.]MBS7009248.1 EAL domain-containing protein [Anaerostipes sp.]
MNPKNFTSETSIYIIDQNYKIVHFNRELQQVFPEISCGNICYEVFCAENSPCSGCPLTAPDNEGTLFFNQKLNQWVEVNTGTISWPGSGICHVVLSRSICEGNKNLFYNLTDMSTYDELFELNFSKDTYRLLYHLPHKYVNPAEEGCLSELLEDAARRLIHPDDAAAFLDFWNIDNIRNRLENASPSFLLLEQFRRKKADGTYCWTAQTIVPIRHSGNSDEIMMCFIQDIQKQKQKELNSDNQSTGKTLSAFIDPLTGLYRKNIFLQKAYEFLEQSKGKPYCLMAIDIEHFKLFNEWYGQKSGDQFLIDIGCHLKNAQEEHGGIAGYMGDDDFCIILPDDQAVISYLQHQIMGYIKRYQGNVGFLPAFGLYSITERHIPVRTMYDRAAIAMSSVKGNYTKRSCRYDSRMMQKMKDNHILLSEIQHALEQEEFTFYAQPKCNMATGRIIGLESLVRWNHPKRGLIPPGDFIPLLESNGFITNLDLYVWELVCRSVRTWIDQGHKAIPISVNVSRVDIYSLDIVETFQNLIQKYSLDPSLIEIEITESAYAEEYELINDAIVKLRASGFTVLMDDFGSGYSSLNMLKDVNVDVLKIDMKFLEMDDQSSGKGYGILEAIISMARFMGLKIIAEGVETKEQMDYLLDMGCTYGQGYYFYHPMPIKVFEPLLADENNLDLRGIKARQLERLHIKELLNENVFSETLLNNIMGGVAFYSVCGKQIELVRANEQYFKITGTNSVDLEEQRRFILENIYEEDRKTVFDMFSRADLNVLNGAESDVRRLKDNGDTIWLHMHVYLLKEQDNRKLYYGSVSDVTEQKLREQRLAASQRALSAVVHISEKDSSFMKLTEDNRRTAASIFAQMSPGGMIGGYCEDGFPLYFANHEMVRLLDYDSFEELDKAIDGKVINTIHPDDREQVARDIGPEYYAGLEYTTSYRMPKKDGTWFWTLDKGKVIEAEDGRLAIVSACTDISEPMRVQLQLAERNSMLMRKNQELAFLNHDMPGGYHRCSDTPGFEFLYVSDRFLQIFGYTKQELQDRFDNKFMNMVHPDDRSLVLNGVEELEQDDKVKNLEYRMLSKNGYIWVIDQSKYMEYQGKQFLQGVVLDVTESVNLRSQMQHLLKHLPESISLLWTDDGDIKFRLLSAGFFKEYGYTLQSLQHYLSSKDYSRTLESGLPEQVRQELLCAMEHCNNYETSFEICLPENKAIKISLNASPVEGTADKLCYLCICKKQDA